MSLTVVGLRRYLRNNRYIDFKPRKPSVRRLCFTMITMMLCYGISTYIVVFDLFSVPKTNTLSGHVISLAPDLSEHDDWSWHMGDHKISKTEHIIMVLTGFFGFMRTIDLFIDMYRYNPKKFNSILSASGH